MITFVGKIIIPTKLALASAKFYFEPYRIFVLYEKLNQIISMDLLMDEKAFSWMLAYNDSHKNLWGEIVDDYKSYMNLKGLEYYKNEQNEAIAYSALFNNKRPKYLKYEMSRCYSNMHRELGLVKYLNDIFTLNCEKEIELMTIQLKYRVNKKTASVMIVFDLYNKNIIQELLESNIETKEDLEINSENILEYCSQELKVIIITMRNKKCLKNEIEK